MKDPKPLEDLSVRSKNVSLRDPGPLENMSAVLLTLIVFYAIALMIVAGIIFLTGSYLFSLLFKNTLFTQDEFILVQGIFIYFIGGIVLFFAMIPMGIMKRKWNLYNKEEERRMEYWFHGLAAGIFAAWILTGVLSLSGEEEYFIFVVFGPFILIISMMNWKVIDIPSKVLSKLGYKNTLKLSRDAAIPVIVMVLSFIPIIYTIRFMDAPVVTIFIVYLEILFAGGVITTFVCMIVLHERLRNIAKVLREEKKIETEHYMDRLADLNVKRS